MNIFSENFLKTFKAKVICRKENFFILRNFFNFFLSSFGDQEVLIKFSVFTLYDKQNKPFAITSLLQIPEDILMSFQKELQKQRTKSVHVSSNIPIICFQEAFVSDEVDCDSDKSLKRRKTSDASSTSSISSISPSTSPKNQSVKNTIIF